MTNKSFTYSLKWNQTIPNALTFPSGIIVLPDRCLFVFLNTKNKGPKCEFIHSFNGDMKTYRNGARLPAWRFGARWQRELRTESEVCMKPV